MTDSNRYPDLEQWLAQATEPPSDDHLEDEDIAAWLDGVVQGQRQQQIELHLSQCESCRLLMKESQRHLDTVKRDAPFRPRRMAIAAGLFLVFSLGLIFRLFSGPSADDLQAFALTTHDLQALSTDFRRSVLGATQGSWSVPPDLPVLLREEAVFRSSDARSAPSPLSPRWSSLSVNSKVFAWQASTSEEPSTHYHLMIVDAEEILVEQTTVAATGEPWMEFNFSNPLPQGESFAWKVTAETRGEWLASEWVPFRTLSSTEEAELESRLEEGYQHPFITAVAYAELGMVDAALNQLASLPRTRRNEEAMTRLWNRKHLTPNLESLDRNRFNDHP